MKKAMRQLPFIKFNPQGTIDSYWHVATTDNWTADNKIGALYAVQLLEYMRAHKSPSLMPSVIRDLPKHGLSHMGGFNGVTIGFLHEIAKRAMG